MSREISTTNDIQRHRNAAVATMVALGLLVVGWGGAAKISGAVIAQGRVAPESGVRRIQHREGGTLSDVMVREGDRVRRGQVLARVDMTAAGATAAIVDGELGQLTARKLRLEAERDGREIEVPENLGADGEVARMLDTERGLKKARAASLDAQRAQLREQSVQAAEDLRGLEAQLVSTRTQLKLVGQELEGIRNLFAKGYATLAKVNQLERESARLVGEDARLGAAIASSRARASQVRMQLSELSATELSKTIAELKEVDAKLAQLRQQRTTAQDELGRTEIRSPVGGIVQQVAFSRGSVVSSGEAIMVVVPDADALVVEAFIDPQHIDQVSAGRSAHIRFPGFAAAATPEFVGRVDRIAADVRSDDRTGATYYLARLRIAREELPAAIATGLKAGMPAEVQIETARRSALSYFLKPLTDQLQRTFRED